MGFIVVIPARYASTRLPGKPLRLLAGKPMIEHVCRRARASGADEVIVATDDDRIAQAVRGFGARACLTAQDHPSGTDRLAEVARLLDLPDDQVLVNLQGDEPLMPPALIDQVAADLAAHGAASIATLCEPVGTAEELFDPHVVKVVLDEQGYALYFSRAVIPWHRDAFAISTRELPAGAAHHRHIGLYAYRAGFIREFVEWEPCALERTEMLEQLRALWRGHRIHVGIAREKPGPGVDTERDLERVEELLRAGGR
ncbi:MAG: 3-deoxy-manno-octulosonate cytidylyltransferase [Gammaproteobacteria bacterium]|nr:3-deoxy-manno-octulosonate cytidylyltransferase [Gammaproteobacteria bacterium]